MLVLAGSKRNAQSDLQLPHGLESTCHRIYTPQLAAYRAKRTKKERMISEDGMVTHTVSLYALHNAAILFLPTLMLQSTLKANTVSKSNFTDYLYCNKHSGDQYINHLLTLDSIPGSAATMEESAFIARVLTCTAGSLETLINWGGGGGGGGGGEGNMYRSRAVYDSRKCMNDEGVF